MPGRPPIDLRGRTAVVSGAASGLGRGLAQALAARGCHLALADLNQDGLAETRALLQDDAKVTLHHLDVADAQAVAAFPDQVMAEHGRVDLLFNNAGVLVSGGFEEIGESDFEWLFSINFWGVVRMTRAFLPPLRQSDDARIVNISSLFGLISVPTHSAYCASKFAVRGFSQSLRLDLRGSTVGVTLVHPGGVATRIAQSGRLAEGLSSEQQLAHRQGQNRWLRMPPSQAAEIIVTAVARRQHRVLVGRDARLLAFLERLAPISYLDLLGWLADKFPNLSSAATLRHLTVAEAVNGSTAAPSSPVSQGPPTT